MSYECAECERDIRGGHASNCSRYIPPTWTGADDITELGGLSANERDQLATDLQREQDLAQDREHVTDGSPCWCSPTTIYPEIDPGLELDGGIDGTIGLPLGVGAPVVDPTPSTGKVQFGERLRLWLESLSAEEMRDLPSWAHNDLGAMIRSLELDVAELRERAFLEGIRHAKSVLGTNRTLATSIVNAEGGGGLDPRGVDRGPLRPLNDQVFLVRVQPPDRTASGLAIPESAQSKGCECRVLAAGPGAKHGRTGERIPMSVAAGDRVVIGKWQGNEVTVPDYARVAWGIDDREPVIVVRETEILAVLAG